MFDIRIACPKCGCPNDFEEALLSKTTLFCTKCKAQICNISPVAGYIYILSNPCMPGLVKIGFTNRSVQERIIELNSATAIPESFVIEATYKSDNPENDEKNVHSFLNGCRKSTAREFFQIEITKVIETITRILGREPNYSRIVNLRSERYIPDYLFKLDPGSQVAQYTFVCAACQQRFYSKGPKSSIVYCPFCFSNKYD
jgi:hypothetical protein